MKTVTIAHPSGVPMKFSESIAAFLLEGRRSDFATGDWLAVLSPEDLTAFIQMAQRWNDGDEATELDDFMGVLLNAIAAEQRTQSVDKSPDEILQLGGMMLVIAGLEANRRLGCIVVHAKLRLFPGPKDTYTITKEGFVAAEEWKGSLH
jgi:hypothetical protein